MSAHGSHDIIIVGGGLAGLALSRQLYHAGIAAVTLERRSAFSDEGFAVNLPGNAIAALHQMGLRQVISAMGRPTGRREYRDHRGRIRFQVDEDAFWGPELRPRCVKRRDLIAALRQGLPDDLFQMSAAVTDVRQSPTDVAATLEDGRVLSASLLIGADGVHSRSRAQTFVGSDARAAVISSASWRFIAPDPGVDCWTVWAGPRSLFLLIPLGDGQVYGWASVSTDRPAPAPGATDDLNSSIAARFADFPRPVTDTLAYLTSHADSVHASPLEEVRIDNWARDRIVLIGDAAHATAPIWAQGVALALEDANALAEALVAHSDRPLAARRFEQARRDRVRHVQRMTDKMSRAARLPAGLRNLLMPFVGPRSYRQTYGPLRP